MWQWEGRANQEGSLGEAAGRRVRLTRHLPPHTHTDHPLGCLQHSWSLQTVPAAAVICHCSLGTVVACLPSDGKPPPCLLVPPPGSPLSHS